MVILDVFLHVFAEIRRHVQTEVWIARQTDTLFVWTIDSLEPED